MKNCSTQIVNAAVEIYNRLSLDLLPTPAKSHYVFNLRDLSKCVQGERGAGSHTHTHTATVLKFKSWNKEHLYNFFFSLLNLELKFSDLYFSKWTSLV